MVLYSEVGWTLWSLGSLNREVGTTGSGKRASFHVTFCVSKGGNRSTGLVLRLSGMGVSTSLGRRTDRFHCKSGTQKSNKNCNFQKSKSVNRRTTKIDRSADEQTVDFIFRDTLICCLLVCWSVNFSGFFIDRFGFLRISIYVAFVCPGFTMKSVCSSAKRERFFYLEETVRVASPTRINLEKTRQGGQSNQD